MPRGIFLFYGINARKKDHHMLILMPQEGQVIILGNTITIRVLHIENGRVKLGIDAPPDVVIVREELLDPAYAATHAPPMRGGAADA
jgi:carbon storage regulator